MRHAVLGVKMDCFRDMKPDSRAQVLSHLRKITCARATCASGLSVVFTPLVAHKGIALACKRNTLALGLNEKKTFSVSFERQSESRVKLVAGIRLHFSYDAELSGFATAT